MATYSEIIDILIRKQENGVTKGIIYVPSVKMLERIVEFINSSYDPRVPVAKPYFARLDTVSRNESFLRWKQNSCVMVATGAFGLGIDEKHVSYVLHAALPLSMSTFIQESGRGGRDSDEPCSSILFYSTKIDTRLHSLLRIDPRHTFSMLHFVERHLLCRRVLIRHELVAVTCEDDVQQASCRNQEDVQCDNCRRNTEQRINLRASTETERLIDVITKVVSDFSSDPTIDDLTSMLRQTKTARDHFPKHPFITP